MRDTIIVEAKAFTKQATVEEHSTAPWIIPYSIE